MLVRPPAFLPRLAELVTTGRLPVGKLVGTFALEDVEEAAAVEAGTTIKPVLVPR